MEDGSWEERIAQDRNPWWKRMGEGRAEMGRQGGVEKQGKSHVRGDLSAGSVCGGNEREAPSGLCGCQIHSQGREGDRN